MRSNRELAQEQIDLQHEMQNFGINLVTCGNCGSILLHRVSTEKIDCFCGEEMDPSDCPDYWYEGVQNNEEFN